LFSLDLSMMVQYCKLIRYEVEPIYLLHSWMGRGGSIAR
jgi:hypothetical protein